VVLAGVDPDVPRGGEQVTPHRGDLDTAGRTLSTSRANDAMPLPYGGQSASCPERNSVANGSLNTVYAATSP
jgi:hypothetical protein